jgi:dephospho-CoA kinase
MLRVGLTGGIGSGKSTVAGIFEVLGIAVSYADQEARRLMNEDEELKAQIVRHFGSSAYSADGRLDRARLAEQVFTDPQKLGLLNSIVHPVTLQAGEKWMDRQQARHAPYAIKEAALIFESRAARGLDHVIGVYAPASLRITRAMKRDGITREEVLKRMKNQIDEEVKVKLCDFVISNDEQEALLPQVLELHERLLELAGRKG